MTFAGGIEEIGGIKTYVVRPEKEYAVDKAVLYLGDIFGIELPNNCVCPLLRHAPTVVDFCHPYL